MPIISRELASGKRVYRCQTWPAFFRDYCVMPETERVHYEMSRTGDPCKFYVDIEDETLARGDTAAFDAAYARVGAFVDWATRKMAACWPELREDAQRLHAPLVDVVWIDASAPDKPKFSVHLVFNLVGNAMFADRAQLHRFTNWLSQEAAREGFPAATHLPSADAVLAAADGDPATAANVPPSALFLADMNVYNEGGREFRLLFSHKFKAPDRVLRSYDPLRGTVRTDALSRADEALFFRALVAYQPADASVHRLLRCAFAGAPLRFRLAASGSLSHRTAASGDASRSHEAADSLCVSGIVLRRKRAREETRPQTLDDFFTDSNSGGGVANTTAAPPQSATTRFARLERLLPRVAEDIERQMDEGDLGLRAHTYFPETGCAVFSSSSHFCEVLNDEHRNNHVYYIAWLDSCVFYQRCPDEDCFLRYVRAKPWGEGGPPPHLRTARGTTRMLDAALWAEARAIACGDTAPAPPGPPPAKRARTVGAQPLVLDATHNAMALDAVLGALEEEGLNALFGDF
jgi:hypothetical protein